jgi:hypothetical protein
MEKSNFFSYTQSCPECKKVGKEGHLGFDSGTGIIRCDGETAHTFESLPGEAETVVPTEEPNEKPDLQNSARGSEPAMTAEEEAALDKAMLEPPRPRDFGSQVVEAVDEVARDPEPPGERGEVFPEVTAEALAELVGTGELGSPRVGLGEYIILPNGDAIVGVRIEEKWVSGLQSEAETQRKTFGEYFQETLDDSLLQWYASVPGVR